MSTIILKNTALRLEFDREYGALVGLTARKSGWEILNQPHLGLSFQLLIPLPDRRNNPVFGEAQPLTNVEIAPDQRSLTFTWDKVTSVYGGVHNIKVQMQVSVTERQAIFALTINNQSEFVVENVYCPYLGNVQHPGDADWFKTFSYNYATVSEINLWPTFDNLRGYFGYDHPIQYAGGAPITPYVLLRDATQGLYVGVHDPSSELVAWHSELRPGYDSSIDARVPETAAISGKDVATRFAAVHVPYIQPGETRALTRIALEPFQGGWHQGVDIYKNWRTGWMTLPDIPEWAREPDAWQQLHINSPEDELRLSFKDLVSVGEECARHGVKAIQLVGWNDGGQDQGNPSHDPDPRLGTFDELKEAIASIQALGVKLILFAKFTWSDRATEWFRDDLHRLAVKDPYGDYYHYSGYQYQTATQALDINTKRLIPMCFSSEEYLKVCDTEFQKMLDLGADGILFDECLHHSPALLCFDTDHGHRYGNPVYANDRKLIENFSRLSEPVNEDFLFAGEACYDWEFEAYHLSYHRSENKQHVALSRYMLPHVPLMTAVTGFNDRNMINQCLLYRYIISYEPYNFKGHLDDYPLTMAYGKRMDALRTELRDYFWDGEFRDTVGAVVTTDDSKLHQPYAVFINQVNQLQGIAVANYEDESVTVYVQLLDGSTLNRYRLVDDDRWHSVDNGITLPPRSAAVVIT